MKRTRFFLFDLVSHFARLEEERPQLFCIGVFSALLLFPRHFRSTLLLATMTRKPHSLAAMLLLTALSLLLLSGVSARRTRVGVVADRSPSISSSSSSSSSLPPLAPRLVTSFHGQAPVSHVTETSCLHSDRNWELWNWRPNARAKKKKKTLTKTERRDHPPRRPRHLFRVPRRPQARRRRQDGGQAAHRVFVR